MKKFLSVVLATSMSMAVYAKETVSVVWPFSVASVSADFSRASIEEANKSQDKYHFVLENKLGAGSSVATNYVLNNQPSILATSSAFFVRPNLYPNDAHDISKFNTLMVQCDAPLMLVSKKFKTLNDLKGKEKITVAVTGLGSATHLFAEELKKHYSGIVVIPYSNGTKGGLNDVIGDNIDITIGFYGEMKPYVESKQLNLLGASGKKSYFGVPTFIDQGVAGPEKVVVTQSLFVPKTVKPEVANEWRTIFQNTVKSARVQNSYGMDDCVDPGVTTVNQLSKWFDDQEKYYKSVTKTVKIN